MTTSSADKKTHSQLEQDLLTAIPAWQESTGKTFLVHGESILQILMETVSAADQENKRKPPRAGSVPPRSTTPVNPVNHYMPGSAGHAPSGRSGVVTPAIRPGSSLEPNSAPVKRQRLHDPASNGRVPLGLHRPQNSTHQRPPSPSKIAMPAKTPTTTTTTTSGGTSSLPRPVAMPIPRPGTQHFALGHGRVPSGSALGYSTAAYPPPSRSASAAAPLLSVMGGAGARVASSGAGAYGHGVARKASRARRESFKPRPSMDLHEATGGTGFGFASGRWGDIAAAVEEEDEGC